MKVVICFKSTNQADWSKRIARTVETLEQINAKTTTAHNAQR